jgi:cytochrome c oxidase subunit IV
MSSVEAKDDPHAADIDRQVRAYISVFVALMALTLLTVWVSYLKLSIRLAVVVALGIATVKGSMVAGVFMHLSSEKKLILLGLALTVFFFLFCLLMPGVSDALNNRLW